MNSLNIDYLENLKPWDLPSVSIHQRCDLPEVSGIYFCVRKSAILYIGMSMNLRTRWASKNHHRFNDVTSFDSVHLAWLQLDLEESEIKRAESFLIDQFQPKFNNTKCEKTYTHMSREDIRNLQIKYAKKLSSLESAQIASYMSTHYENVLQLQKTINYMESVISLMIRKQQAHQTKAKELKEALITETEYDKIDTAIKIPNQDLEDLEKCLFALFETLVTLIIDKRMKDIKEAYTEVITQVINESNKITKHIADGEFSKEVLDWQEWLFDLAKETMPKLNK